MQQSVLIIEDDYDIAELLIYNFTKAGFKTYDLATGKGVVELVEKVNPSIIMLDIMIPEGNGLDILQKIRQSKASSQIPIIMVTAKGEEEDITKGLNLGADDYVCKPFSPKELIARANAVLRRSSISSDKKVSPVTIDLEAHRTYVDNQIMELTASEFKLLNLMKSNNGKVLTRDKMVNSLVGADTHIEERNIDVHIRSLRKKLGEYSSFIETVRSIGYRWQE